MPARRRWVAVTIPLVVLAVAGLLRLVDLGHIDRIQFDESYYANDAHALVERGVEIERPAHPPVGKWVLAAGIAMLGFDPVGWRIGSAVAGTAMVLATYGAGLLLLRDRWLAAAAALLVAVDGLAITTSRIAMLDAVLALFVSLALLLLLRHHRLRARAPVTGRFTPAGPELWLAGVALGLAVGTKWSAAPMLAVAVVLVGWTEVRRRRPGRGVGRAVLEGGVATVLPLVVVPVTVYLASYGGFLLNYTDSKVYEQRCPELDCEASVSERVAGLVFHHRDLYRMHRELEHTHPYRSSAPTWPILQRPVLSYLERCPTTDDTPCVVPEGTTARVVMVGNPALWWTMLAALPLVAWQVVRRRDRALIGVLALAASLYVPWLGLGRGYLFYLAPLVPFAALALVAGTRSLPGRAAKVAPWAVLAVAVALLGFLFPIWYGIPLDADATDARLLLDSWR
ncbi:phospholipid carrier-dependent glycosyltransferase [Acidimicrobiia bacterium EGI L10123]|uniref:phospholipid carrier-dependent glycosyltransferase n=1 Tax=Salinilacustrithrix flava TaxID=2957203 RepID=UPI003D7C29CD|nr:phospholipid carrier-dependent glycosyltransferase [Acidimicrobiia bacterium EGI L10123]